MDDLNIDKNLLAEFIDESVEGLESLPATFIKLEKNVNDTRLINDIFRPIHTIKGNSAFFGMMHVKALTHEAETLLDKMRKGKIQVNADLITLLIKSVEHISSMLLRIRGGLSEVEDPEKLEIIISQLKQSVSIEQSPELNINEFLLKAEKFKNSENLTEIGIKGFDKLLSIFDPYKNLEIAPEQNNVVVHKILQLLKEIKGGVINEAQHIEFKNLLKQLEEIAEKDPAKKLVAECVDNYQTMFPVVNFDVILIDLISEGLMKINSKDLKPGGAQEIEKKSPAIEPSLSIELDKNLQGKSNSEELDKKVLNVMAEKTMRIPENRIDSFLSNIGELIVVREMFEHLRKKMVNEISDSKIMEEFRRMTESFTVLTFNLEESVMSIRKQSIATVFRKAPKIVRDVCQKSGKKVEVVLEGDDVEIDKSLLGILEGPLVHMVRNSADHGIEMPNERKSKNKPETGKIKVSMEELDTHLLMTISDDGKGLDLKAIKNKAIELNLIKSDQELQEKDVLALLFMSGVSTAKEITDISGRGVGMDVVRRNVEEVGGKINVFSEADIGTKFSIELPKSITTQILNGFIVRVGENSFVFPVSRIIESFPPEKDKQFMTENGRKVVRRYEEIFPIVNLQEVFKLSNDGVENIFVVAEESGQKIAFLVNEIIGIQQVVLKPLNGLHLCRKLFLGGALMGDGSIALVLDLKVFLSEDL